MTARSVVLALRPPRVMISVVEGHPRGELDVGGERYTEKVFSPEPFLGFYDWLRTRTGRLVGFRMTIGLDLDSFCAFVPRHSYITHHTEHIFSVMFQQPDAEIDEEASTEQDFGETHAFIGPAGDLAIAVDASALSEEELAGLEDFG